MLAMGLETGEILIYDQKPDGGDWVLKVKTDAR